jgi:hypothetical protein
MKMESEGAEDYKINRHTKVQQLQDNNMEKGSSEVFWVTKRTLAYLP